MYKRSEVEKNALNYFEDSLVANVWLDKYALKIDDDNYLEFDPDDTIKRIVGELHRIEQTYSNPLSYTEIYDLLSGYNKFVLGGSCLFGIGNNLTLSTLGNCFVVDSPIDSIGGIWKTDEELAQLMKRRGGVGVDLSSIRSRKTKVNNAAISSTGVVPFMEKYSNTTRTIAQEGRRGALMLSLDIEHPDSEEFIVSKDDLNKITGANISVRVSNEFMKHLDNERNQNLWKKLIHQAWKTAEPGILFWDKIISESPADCYNGFKTISTNPCSELPLCAYDSCRLSAMNLYAYVVNPFQKDAHFNFPEFYKDSFNAQRLMDNIIDLECEKIDAILNKIKKDLESPELKRVEYQLWFNIKEKLLYGRRTGLGQMGLADTFAALNIKYGSDESIEIAHNISQTLARASYVSSINMAKERGAFIVWDNYIEINNPFINRIKNILSEYETKMYYNYGRRNIANLTIAPTGSISMLAKVSSGIEPVFALSYQRKRKVSANNTNKKSQDKQGDWWEEYTVCHSKFQQFLNTNSISGLMNIGDFNYKIPNVVDGWQLYNVINPSKEQAIEMSPYFNSCAHEIDPYTKLKLQSAIQPWIDHSISITYNLPKETKEEEVADLYLNAWKLGLKGLTVYRDESRDGILTTNKSQSFKEYDAPKRPKDLKCDVYNIMAKGKPWKVFIGLMDNRPYEVFAVNGKLDKIPIEHGTLRKVHGGRYDLLNLDGTIIVEDITHNMSQEEEAFTRIVSWALRHGAKLSFGVEQLNKSEGDITSFTKAIARTLCKYCKKGEIRGIVCPTCGNLMISEGGCFVCKECGNNKCD